MAQSSGDHDGTRSARPARSGRLSLLVSAAACLTAAFLLHPLFSSLLSDGESMEFIRYIPSTIESAWLQDAGKYDTEPSKICQNLETLSWALKAWVSTTANPSSMYTSGDGISEDIFSTFLYKNKNGKYMKRYIEPLVGHFRHPFALPHCMPSGEASVHVEDRSYVAFRGMQRMQNDEYPGKRYLFDLGTGYFQTSLQFFVDKYRQVGVEFDRIWAWELSPMPDYWASVPSDMVGRVHLYNTGVPTNLSSASHPFQILKSVFKPGDFVVFKLDIDQEAMEMEMFSAIGTDSALQRSIAELMYEMHYDTRDMRPYFGDVYRTTYTEVLKAFRSYREQGIYLHYWP